LNQKLDIWKTNEFLRELNLPEFVLAGWNYLTTLYIWLKL
jgi:hypothetical protein